MSEPRAADVLLPLPAQALQKKAEVEVGEMVNNPDHPLRKKAQEMAADVDIKIREATESVLSQSPEWKKFVEKGITSEESIEWLKEKAKELGEVTGPSRERDWVMEQLEKLSSLAKGGDTGGEAKTQESAPPRDVTIDFDDEARALPRPGQQQLQQHLASNSNRREEDESTQVLTSAAIGAGIGGGAALALVTGAALLFRSARNSQGSLVRRCNGRDNRGNGELALSRAESTTTVTIVSNADAALNRAELDASPRRSSGVMESR